MGLAAVPTTPLSTSSSYRKIAPTAYHSEPEYRLWSPTDMSPNLGSVAY